MRSLSFLASTVSVLLLSSCAGHSWNFNSSVSMPNATQKAEREIDLPLEIAAGGRLKASTSYGRVTVRADAASAPNVHARLIGSGRTDEEAQEVLDRYSVVLVPSADGVTVRLEGKPLELREGGTTYQLSASADFEIVVPEGVRIDARSGSGEVSATGALAETRLESNYGSIAASGIRGALEARTSSGSVEVRDVKGDVEARSSYGKVDLADIEGARIVAVSSSGDVTLEDARAETAQLKTSYGKVRVARVTGSLEAESSSGSVIGDELDGARIRLHSGYGRVEARHARGALTLESSSGDVIVANGDGTLDAKTSYGKVNAEGVWSEIAARSSSGSVSVRALAGSELGSGWNLTSGYGAVTLAVPDGFACTLDAQTSYGSAKCDFPLTVEAGFEPKQGRLRGQVGGGGATVELRSSSGSVRLERRPD